MAINTTDALHSEMLYTLRDSGKYLYHYTSMTTFAEKILPHKSLRLSPYTHTNDPKESKQWRFDASIRDGAKYKFEDWPADMLCARMNDGLKQHTNVVCFSRDGVLTGDHLTDVHHRGWCKPRMWDQYGDEHRGVCLVLDRSILESAFNNSWTRDRLRATGAVGYRDRNITERFRDPAYWVIIDELADRGWEGYIRFHLQHSYKRLFFEKHSDWATEAEYRLVLWGGSGAAEYVDIGPSLRGVMFGVSASDEAVYSVYNVLHDSGMFVQKLLWQGCAPWYDFNKVAEWEMHHLQRGANTSGLVCSPSLPRQRPVNS